MNLLFDYIVALTNLYGIVEKDKVLEIYNLQNELKKSISDVEFLMQHQKIQLRKNHVEVEGRYFAHEAVFVSEDNFEQLLRQKTGKPYYIPEKEVLLRYKDDEYYEETAQTKEMYRFLEKDIQYKKVHDVEDVFYDVLTNCQMEVQPVKTIQRLNHIGITFPTKKEAIQALNLITDLYNHTRIWSNNGFTPDELFEMEKAHLRPLPQENLDKQSTNQPSQQEAKKVKVGRNDPCPCGSGKKYKKCCLLKA